MKVAVANKVPVFDDDQLGTISKSGKRNRKQKKMNEKEIQYFFDHDDSLKQQPLKVYQNICYLSSKEKLLFEQQFHQPKNKSQECYTTLLQDKNKKIVVSNGPAGTGKTLFATEYGIKFLLTGVYDKLIFTRPSVSVDEDLGYLPGNLEEKMAPWVRPIYDILYRFLSPREVIQMMDDKIIEISPLGFMRGRTFVNAWIVADEMQNSTVSQMKMLLTRLGENSRLIITGDLEQYDHNFEINGLDDFLQRFKGKRSSSISSFEFERSDIQREEVVKEILDIYSREVLPDYSSEENSV
jgi:phosphate starvation-inducible protein PhoH